jgi:hypothetical protein
MKAEQLVGYGDAVENLELRDSPSLRRLAKVNFLST